MPRWFGKFIVFSFISIQPAHPRILSYSMSSRGSESLFNPTGVESNDEETKNSKLMSF